MTHSKVHFSFSSKRDLLKNTQKATKMAILVERSDPFLRFHHNNLHNNNINNTSRSSRSVDHQVVVEEQEMVFTVSSSDTHGNSNSNSNSNKSVPAPFLTKTYQLVNDARTDHIVSWGEDEASFVVWRPPEFARDLLPNYFKHNNFSSFVRQLNTYGFKKVVADRWEFANDYFKKGEKQLLCEIHRRKTPTNYNQINYQDQLLIPPHYLNPNNNNTSSILDENNNIDQSWFNNNIDHNNNSPLPSPNKPYNTNNNGNPNDILTALSEDNQQLRKRNYMLLSELNHMKTLYNDIIYFIQNHVKPIPSSNNNSNENAYSYNDVIRANNNEPPTKLIVLDEQDDQSNSTPRIVKDQSRKTIKLFGVPLHSKKRLHPSAGN